jgi:hypothetical protein
MVDVKQEIAPLQCYIYMTGFVGRLEEHSVRVAGDMVSCSSVRGRQGLVPLKGQFALLRVAVLIW